MRKKLAGIHLLAPLNESDIIDLSRNLDRELIINTTPVTDAVIDTYEKTNYIVTFEYDTTLDGGTNRIRRSIPTLELLGNTDANISGTHWIKLENKDYHYIDDGATAQRAFEQLDEQLGNVSNLRHLLDATGVGALVSSDDGITPSSTVDDSEYVIALGKDHILSNAPYSAIYGGNNSTITGINRAIIVGGYENIIVGNGTHTAIYGGDRNTISGTIITYNVIINGYENKIDGVVTNCNIIGGKYNYIHRDNTNSNNASIIGSSYNKIVDGAFSSIYNSTYSNIYNSTYSCVNLSEYIEIGDSINAISLNSTNNSIGNSTFVNIISSTYNDKNLSMYNSTLSLIEGSTNSYIWNSNNALMSASVDSSIGRNVLTTNHTTQRTNTSLFAANVSDFYIGQLVSLTGAEFTKYTKEYRIYNINDMWLDFVDDNNTPVTFDTSNSNPITIKALNKHDRYINIISNTNDTIVLDSHIMVNMVGYVIIGNSLNRYSIIPANASDITNNIKLKLYNTDTIITTLNVNEFAGMYISAYTKIPNATNAVVLGSTNVHTYNVYNACIMSSINTTIQSTIGGTAIATYDGKIDSAPKGLMLGGVGNYIYSCAGAVMIGGEDNKIHTSTNGIILGGNNNNVMSGSRSIIILGENNIVSSCNDVAVIACKDYEVPFGREYALITNSLTLVDRTLELTDNEPHAGDVLLVDSVVDGNIAKVKWGSINSTDALISSTTYTLYGSSLMYQSMNGSYISLNLDDSTISDTGIAVGMTITGYDYDTFWRMPSDLSVPDNLFDKSGNLWNSTDGLLIENGYRYQITFNSFDIDWTDLKSVNTPDLSMSCSTTINIKSNPTDYIVEYSVNGAAYQELISGYLSQYGWMIIDGLSGSNIDSPRLSGLYKRETAHSGGYLKLLLSDVQQQANYTQSIDAQYYYASGSGTLMVIWPSNLELPTSEQIDGGACIHMKGRKIWIDGGWNAINDDGWGKLRIVSVISVGSRIVQLAYSSNPGDSAVLTASFWSAELGPRLSVSTQVSVTKISETVINMFG